jgi:hypothetical protein
MGKLSGPGADPMQRLREDLMRAIGSRHVAKWRGTGWQALLTRERYGLHFSVSGQGRLPTDEEVDAAFRGYRCGLWVEDHLTEVTSAHQILGAVNPYVRHFVPDEQAQFMFDRAAEKQERDDQG